MAGNWQTRMENKKVITILAIESSCDETAAAVVRNGKEVLSNVISSQIELLSNLVTGIPVSEVSEYLLIRLLVNFSGQII